jgi:hypothetical protein
MIHAHFFYLKESTCFEKKTIPVLWDSVVCRCYCIYNHVFNFPNLNTIIITFEFSVNHIMMCSAYEIVRIRICTN